MSFRKILFTILTVISFAGYGFFVYASAPSGGYNPGQTLNPDCAPGDTDCIVKSPLITANNGLTATGTNVQLGGLLTQTTLIDLGTATPYNFGVVGNVSDADEFGMRVGHPSAGLNFAGFYTKGTDGSQSAVSAISVLGGTYVDIVHRNADFTRSRMVANDTSSFLAYENVINNQFTQVSANNGDASLVFAINGDDIGEANYVRVDSTGVSIQGNNNVTGNNMTWSAFVSVSVVDELAGLTNSGNWRWNHYTDSRDDSGSYSPLNFLYTDNNGNVLSTSLNSTSWLLGGNSGTDGGVSDFIGTTDGQDFVIKTASAEIARFGQSGNVAFGSALGGGVTTNLATGANAFAIGSNTAASGHLSFSSGFNTVAPSWGEVALGLNSTIYAPNGPTDFYDRDRLFSIGNSELDTNRHNAYTLWKDGSFAYNDDNFQNDNPGTEQNMFYFNYGNHDGLANSFNRPAIRLGSVLNNEWDIASSNVGYKSIAIGFTGGAGSLSPTASGENSIAIGQATASGSDSFALGYRAMATGNSSITIGSNSGDYTNTIGDRSVTILAGGSGGTATNNGSNNMALLLGDACGNQTINGNNGIFIGCNPTINASGLFIVGNGSSLNAGAPSDAFTILHNGQTGIGINEFITNSNGNIFQVGDGTTNVIGYVDDVTGNWVAVSDERKKENIADLTYGLNELIQLRPTSFDYKRNHEHTIGFIAQQVLPIIPEAVYGTESEGYGMSYATLTPVIVKAIQEMNLNVTQLSDMTRPNTWRDAIIAWFANTANGITDLFVKRVVSEQLCLTDIGGQTCYTRSQLNQALGNVGTHSSTPGINNPPVIPPTDTNTNDDGSSPADMGDNTSTPPPSDTSGDTSNPLPSDTGTPTDSGTPAE